MEIIEIMKILLKYDPKADIDGASHDVIWFNGKREGMSAEDIEALDKMGVFWASEYDCWTKFV